MSASQSRTADSTSVWSTDLQVEGRAADDLEHIGGGGLLLQRFAQLVEQAGVLDGDDGLTGEVLDQLDLLAVESADLLTVDHDASKQFSFLHHGNTEHGACATKIVRRAFLIHVVHNVADMYHGSCLDHPIQSRAGARRPGPSFAKKSSELFRHLARRNRLDYPIFVPEQHGKAGATHSCGILQHRPKDRLQFPRSAGDESQHLRSRRLLLQRLGKVHPCGGELAFPRYELLFQLARVCLELRLQFGTGFPPDRARSRLRSFRTKRATMRSALRPLARQGHLVGIATGPFGRD